MRVEVINTGNELLIGKRVNTHAAYFGGELMKLGIQVQKQVCVPDGDAIGKALQQSMLESDLVLVTGGLGPTSDDLTRELTAELLGLELIEDESAMRSMEEFFKKRNKPMAAVNRKQAFCPVGAEIIPNPNGTAPGVYVPPRLSGDYQCAVVLLPGPPRELYPMFEQEVIPKIKALGGIETPDLTLELKTHGVGESDIQQEIDHELAAIEGLEHGYCARLGEVDIRLVGSVSAVASGRAVVEKHYQDSIISDQGEELPEVVLNLLKAKGLQMTIAESCTGGLISHRITNVLGSSASLTYGFVTYSNESKVDLLGVSSELIEAHGAVSKEVSQAMATGALIRSGADIALSVTGIAGPGGGSEEKPVGTVFISCAIKGQETITQHQCHPRQRVSFKEAVSQSALDLVRRRLVGVEI